MDWGHQVQNDFILNYEINFERNISSGKSFISLNGVASIRAGTLNDRAGAGFEVMLGKFDSPFQNAGNENKRSKQNFRFHFYDQPEINFVGYDATLQGGIFNRKSPYTISSKQICRISFQNNFGIVMSFRKIHFEYFQSFLTKEFSFGKKHRWGGVRMSIEL